MSIDRLSPRHGTEAWITRALAAEVESAFAEELGTVPSELRWYLWAYPENRPSRLVWFGRRGVVPFIRFAQARTAPGGRPGPLRHPLPYPGGCPGGDVSPEGRMVCGDTLFVALWDRLRTAGVR